MAYDDDVIIVCGGLAGLVAAAELAESRKKIIIVDQEPKQSLGGQAFWSLGGIFLVDSPEQRRFRRNVFHPCDGGLLRLAMHLATEVWPISMPSLRSSPWIRGAPQRGLARLVSRINWRISSGTFDLLLRDRDFHFQNKRKSARCQRITVSGLTITRCLVPAFDGLDRV